MNPRGLAGDSATDELAARVVEVIAGAPDRAHPAKVLVAPPQDAAGAVHAGVRVGLIKPSLGVSLEEGGGVLDRSCLEDLNAPPRGCDGAQGANGGAGGHDDPGAAIPHFLGRFVVVARVIEELLERGLVELDADGAR